MRFLITPTRYIKQDLIATGLREITLRMIIIVVCINAHDIIRSMQSLQQLLILLP